MSLIDELYPVSKKECKAASQILANSFSEKPMLKKLNIPMEDMRNMFEMMIRFSLRYGEVYATSAKLEGILVFLPEKYALMKGWQVIRSGAIFPVLRIKKTLMQILKVTGKIMDEDKKNLNIGPYIYGLSIGIAQGHQGKGLGGELMKALIEKADNEKKAIYLETDTKDNVTLYKHFGFEVVKEIVLPDLEIPMWEMARMPITS
ncbi:MAG: GNAT family N-acetyltransferase [bacterium]|nr:GNAT family N-acetyltransferase [bacterium]